MKNSLAASTTAVLILAALTGGWLALGGHMGATHAKAPSYELMDANKQVIGHYSVPPDSAIAKEANAAQIMQGKRLLNETARLLPDNVGAGINCNSCHLSQGKTNLGANYFNTINGYPKVMPRAGKMVDMAARINGCFQRSMNGKPLPPESEEMLAMIAYYAWLGTGVEKGQRVKAPAEGRIDESLLPDSQRGQAIYAAQCATCHGDQGQGMKDQFGDFIFPPLWGDQSFNIGAGMARTYKAAAFVRYNMPMGVHMGQPMGQGGVLSEQEAVDVAEYFTHMPRPDFAGKHKDWPTVPKPKDARY